MHKYVVTINGVQHTITSDDNFLPAFVHYYIRFLNADGTVDTLRKHRASREARNRNRLLMPNGKMDVVRGRSIRATIVSLSKHILCCVAVAVNTVKSDRYIA